MFTASVTLRAADSTCCVTRWSQKGPLHTQLPLWASWAMALGKSFTCQASGS